jgi:hypothetical protein
VVETHPCTIVTTDVETLILYQFHPSRSQSPGVREIEITSTSEPEVIVTAEANAIEVDKISPI